MFGLDAQASASVISNHNQMMPPIEPARENEWSQRINNILGYLRDTRSTYPSCFVVRQGNLIAVYVLLEGL